MVALFECSTRTCGNWGVVCGDTKDYGDSTADDDEFLFEGALRSSTTYVATRTLQVSTVYYAIQ